MQTIQIDFDVFKEITLRRKAEDVTPNDVLRELFGLEPKKESASPKTPTGKPWLVKKVAFPPGTEFRATYKGQTFQAKVEDGAMVFDGRRFLTPSSAAISITGNSVNGWVFWECKLPGNQNWQMIKNLRAN